MASDVICCASTRTWDLIWLGVASHTPAVLGLWGSEPVWLSPAGRQPSCRFSEQACLQSIRRVTEQSIQRLNGIRAWTTFTSIHRRGKGIEGRKGWLGYSREVQCVRAGKVWRQEAVPAPQPGRGMDVCAQFMVSLLLSPDPPSPWNYTDHIWSEPFLHNPVTSSQTWDGAGARWGGGG